MTPLQATRRNGSAGRLRCDRCARTSLVSYTLNTHLQRPVRVRYARAGDHALTAQAIGGMLGISGNSSTTTTSSSTAVRNTTGPASPTRTNSSTSSSISTTSSNSSSDNEEDNSPHHTIHIGGAHGHDNATTSNGGAGAAGAGGSANGVAAGAGGATVVSGPQVDSMTDAALRHVAMRCNVFARASPENKLRIVRALQVGRETRRGGVHVYCLVGEADSCLTVKRNWF